MRSFIESLFLHFFTMMFIPLINNMFFRQKTSFRGRNILFVTIVFSLLLTFLFPIQIADGLEFDMKFISMYIAYFYLGPLFGILTIAALIMVKAIMDPAQLGMLIINYSLMAFLFYWSAKYYKRFSYNQKLLQAISFYSMITITRFIFMTYTNNQEYYLHLLIFTAVSSLALCCIIYLLETSRLQEPMLDQLKNAEKLNAISQLAASVAHEIRNPMTTINVFLQMLKDEENLTKDQQMYISISLTELDRTHHIINDFLSLSRPGNIHTEIFSVSTSLIEIADFTRPYSAYSNVEIIVHIDENLTMIGNQNEFKQLILNFLKNGIESMDQKGG